MSRKVACCTALLHMWGHSRCAPQNHARLNTDHWMHMHAGQREEGSIKGLLNFSRNTRAYLSTVVL
jgi:hypothetical protein